ncbi:hypothetical protein PTKIN_Ptkin17bG0156400 [Pterospermum kingtungense]
MIVAIARLIPYCTLWVWQAIQMTIKQRQYFENVSQQDKIAVFECPKDLIEQVRRQIEDERVCPSEENVLVEGGNSLLLMLANSAELMSESEDNLGLDSTTEAQCLQENVNDVMATTDSGKNSDKVDETPPIARERIEKDGSRCEGTVSRLSQIRRLARLRSRSFIQKSIEKDAYRRLQGSKIRLTQIRRQARWGNRVPVQKDIARFSNGKLIGGVTRLSHVRHQARSKRNC